MTPLYAISLWIFLATLNGSVSTHFKWICFNLRFGLFQPQIHGSVSVRFQWIYFNPTFQWICFNLTFQFYIICRSLSTIITFHYIYPWVSFNPNKAILILIQFNNKYQTTEHLAHFYYISFIPFSCSHTKYRLHQNNLQVQVPS